MSTQSERGGPTITTTAVSHVLALGPIMDDYTRISLYYYYYYAYGIYSEEVKRETRHVEKNNSLRSKRLKCQMELFGWRCFFLSSERKETAS